MWLSWARLCFGLLVVFIACTELDAASFHHRKHKKTHQQCGYEGCPQTRSDMLNVHLVAHTHDDVGWLKTVDQYYYGSRMKTQKASVANILDSVVDTLLKDSRRRFIYVESAFFFKWWEHQTKERKAQVKILVNEGRLEFIGGAWSMNDEAATHYQSTVDQFTYGLRRLNDTFGECARPKIGWQIDPFGHAREFASLLAQMGYDGLFFGRIDYQDKIERLAKHNGEVIWQASDNLGSKADLFSGVLYNNYSPPPGFCFDTVLCNDDLIIDDKSSPEYNLDEKLDKLIKYFEDAKRLYRTNNVLITMGEDFNYQDAPTWFKNLDKLILHLNERQSAGLKMNMFYSTPSCYLKAVHDSGYSNFSTKQDDYFPYASDVHSFWTGYFTSRPTLKRFERVGNHYLQVCKQLSVLANKKTSTFDENLNNMREVMGVMQHHDAVTGTEKQHVAEDYARLLQIGFDKCSENIKEALNQLSIENNNEHGNLETAQNQDANKKFQFDYVNCASLNISSCAITEKSEKFMVTLYNVLAHSTFQYVRVPVSDPDSEYEILDYRNVPVNSQLVSIPNQVQSISFRQSHAKAELVFMANEIPPLGYKSYFIQKKSKSTKNIEPVVTLVPSINSMSDDPSAGLRSGPFTIGNQYLNLTFGENGLLESMATDEVDMKIHQNFYLYEGYLGNNEISRNRSSGAYIFRPKGEALEIANHADVRVVKGDLVDEVHQTFNEWISQVIRIYKNENYAEFEWLVGPIPIEYGVGREIITRFDTDIESNGIFYTDSNGREMLKRKRDHRDTWSLVLSEKVSGNYYPVTAKIAIEDEKRRFAILNDRAQGGSSLMDGSIELMVHRRLLHDDAFGVGEALNETAFGKGLIARGSHYLVFGPRHSAKQSTEAAERFIQLKSLLPSWLFFSDVSDLSYDTWKDSYKHIFSGLSLSLPQNIHLLTFEPWRSDSILVRFEHILEKDEDQQYSKPVSFDFHDVFRGLNVASIRETTLSENQWLDKAKRLNFTSDVRESSMGRSSYSISDQSSSLHRAPKAHDLTITLNPMEIRTFVVELE